MKLYAAMVLGIALGVGVALVLAARELEDEAPTTALAMPVAPLPGAPPGSEGGTTGA